MRSAWARRNAEPADARPAVGMRCICHLANPPPPQDNGQPSVVGRLPACWEWWNHRAGNLRNPAGLLLNLRNGQFGTGKHDKTISPFAARMADLVSRE